jgi:hypothetical protein
MSEQPTSGIQNAAFGRCQAAATMDDTALGSNGAGFSSNRADQIAKRNARPAMDRSVAASGTP